MGSERIRVEVEPSLPPRNVSQLYCSLVTLRLFYGLCSSTLYPY